MSGFVTIVIRKKNGEISSQIRNTNPTPNWFVDERFYQGDEPYLNDYINRPWTDDGKPAPQTLIVPHDYGVVVADFMTGHLLSMQSYTSYDYLHPFRIEMLAKNKNDHKDRERVERLLAANRVKFRVIHCNEDDKTSTTISVPFENSFSGMLSIMERFKNGEFHPEGWVKYDFHPYSDFCVDTTPLTYEQFDVNPSGSRALLERLDSIGFPICEKSRKAWTEQILEEGLPIPN